MINRPNILMIMTDNQPADMLGCYGNDEVLTPHIDRLAATGTRFSNAFCVNAMCSPCRASVLTGLMPSAHGVHTWLDDGLASEWPEDWNAIGEFATLPGQLKSAGYSTALIGKYHLGQPWRAPADYDHWVTFPHGHTVSFHGNRMIENGSESVHEGHSVDFFADRTVDYLGSRGNEPDPFFCFVPFNGPYGHWPAIRGESQTRFDEIYRDLPLHSIPREGLNRRVIERYTQRVVEAGGTPHERFAGPLLLPNETTSLRNYFAQTSLIDDAVGRIMTALDENGLAEDTIVIYTADHGFSLGHHGIWGHGLAAWPSSMLRPSYHVPLVMAGPGIATADHDGLVSQIDIPNTLLHAAGAALIETDRHDSRVIALDDPGRPVRDALCIEQEESRAIRTAGHLYVERFSQAGGTPLPSELYELENDPGERHDLAAEGDGAAVASELSAQLKAYFDRHAAPGFDLWSGGRAKSNITNPAFWQNAWGPEWGCTT